MIKKKNVLEATEIYEMESKYHIMFSFKEKFGSFAHEIK